MSLNIQKQPSGLYIPFSTDGNMLRYDYSLTKDKFDMEFTFIDELTFSSFRHGQSTSYAVFTRTNGKLVHMTLADFKPLVPLLVRGKIKAKWGVRKQGSAFSLVYDPQPTTTKVKTKGTKVNIKVED
jgi:hypothetical protein